MNQIETELEQLLDQICVDLGFFLPPLIKSRLIKFPPKTAEKCVKVIIESEGLNIDVLDKALYKKLFIKVDSVYCKYT
ncbi:hypothetical protein [Shewanella sp. 10N.286.54.B9]|uniref:hypothetical protein n=1 Tax=Shewanella sp. 10N.286.54.B9 TaxID=3229719 RepID=UPI00355471FB